MFIEVSADRFYVIRDTGKISNNIYIYIYTCVNYIYGKIKSFFCLNLYLKH